VGVFVLNEKDIVEGFRSLSLGKHSVAMPSLPKVKIVHADPEPDPSYMDNFLDRVNSIDSRNVKLAGAVIAVGATGYYSWKYWDVIKKAGGLISKSSKDASAEKDDKKGAKDGEEAVQVSGQAVDNSSSANIEPASRPATPYRDADELQKQKQQQQQASQDNPGITTANGQEYSYWPNIFG
jgi:hypothetical protein